MKKLLFILAMICLITSCNKTPVITLSVDKTEISADGKDVVKFTVICNDEEDVTSKSVIFFADSKEELGATTFSTTEPKTYSFYATYKDAVSDEVTVTANKVEEDNEDENENGDNNEDEGDNEGDNEDENGDENGNEDEEQVEGPIVLSASTDTIVADGISTIEFTVIQDDIDITSSSKFFVNDNLIEGNQFKTTVAGSYTAYAKKNDTVVSNEIKFFAKAVNNNEEEEEEEEEEEKPIELSASTTTIVANGSESVTFTVTQDNNDVTSQSNIFVNGSKLSSNKFTTYTAGTYVAYAQKNEVKSNEITIYVEAVADMGKTVVFAEGVSVSSGWYDVNKLTKGGEDVNMCWAAASANIIQWWQDRYVAAGNTLPSTAITGEGTKSYNGTKYNLAIMEAYRDLWDNSRGGSVSHGVTWYFEGRNIMKEASAGTHAQPLSNNTGGYYANDWNKILPNIYHGYDYVIIPGTLEYNDLITGEFNNYYTWGGGSGLSGNASLKKFSDLVVEFIDKGMTSLTVALAANLGSIHHATTLWGYEIDNSTGILTKVWLTDSDDMHQTGESGNPTEQKLREYTVSYNDATGTIKFSGAPYGACYAVSLYPVSGYGSR